MDMLSLCSEKLLMLIEDILSDPRYQIRSDGSIWTVVRAKGSGEGPWRPCAVSLNKEGYGRVRYKKEKIAIHRIVYRKYKGHLDAYKTIDHKDGNPGNNAPDNLEQVSQGENSKRANRDRRRKTYRYQHKLTESEVRKIREEHDSGKPYSVLSQEYDVGKSTISYVINRKTWKEVR